MIFETGELIYLYDGSFDGLLTAIFEIYLRKEEPKQIVFEENFQHGFDQIVRNIQTDEDKSKRVGDGFRKKCGKQAFDNIVTAFLCADEGKSYSIYKYMKIGFALGRSRVYEIGYSEVLDIVKICERVKKEAHLMTGFIRFRLMEDGIFYSKIEPTHNIIPIVMPFFADRYSDQPFIVHAPNHQIAGYYDLQKWVIVEVEELNLSDMHEDGLDYEKMWKRFYETIAIKERTNSVCRRNHMPMKYWKNLPEMKFYRDDDRRSKYLE